MATISWAVTIGGTSFTTITQSLSFAWGRQSYFDTYTGQNVTLTVRNNSGQASNVSEGDQIVITNNYGSTSMYFYVVEVTFQDDIATNNATATITGVDALGMLSLFYVNDDPIIGTNNAVRQAIKLANEVYPFVPPYPPPTEVDGRATVSDAFDPTTIGQRVVELINTENSSYYYDGSTIEFRTSAEPGASLFSFSTTGSSSALVYDGLTRKYPNANYPNVVNLTSTTVGTTTAVSTSNYERNFSRQVLFNTTAQQQAQTDWFANVFAVESLYVDVRFSDKANSTGAITYFVDALPAMFGKTVSVTYTPPGGSSTTTTFVIEGGSASAIPGRSEFTVYLSPTVVYDLFTLDSLTFGILNTNRLGW